jgi:hypothetical protein
LPQRGSGVEDGRDPRKGDAALLLPCHLHPVRTFAAFVVAVVSAAVVTVVASPAVAAPTRATFISKGDAVCAQTKRELAPIKRRADAAKLLPQSEQWAAVSAIYADQIEIQKRFVSRFRTIGAPAGDVTAKTLINSLAKGVSLAVRVQQGFAAHDAAVLQTALPAYLRFTVDLNRRVVAYGFRICGR